MLNLKTILVGIRFIRDRFDLTGDMALKEEIQNDVWNSVELRGTNLWVLLFAIIIASVGLNTNSTAVIIGAMLISPLMGPLIGFGYGLGVHDFELIKKSARSIFIAVLASLFVSTVYFILSPLGEAHSEILARTNPTIWDVIIAFSGGITGMIANSRKSKSNVIPGVAIATALMPPLCTAGYGIATLQLRYFVGAFYLFFINSVFIAFGTFLIVRLLKIENIEVTKKELRSKIETYIWATIIVTILPSFFMAYKIVEEEIETQRIKAFIDQELITRGIVVIDKQVDSKNERRKLSIFVSSGKSREAEKEDFSEKLKYYGLQKYDLQITEFNSDVGVEAVKAKLMSELSPKYNVELISLIKSEISKSLPKLELEGTENGRLDEIRFEIIAQIGAVESVFIGYSSVYKEEKSKVLLLSIKTKTKLNAKYRQRFYNWLKIRSKSDDVKILWE